jgi:hypothetical protein
MDTSIVRHSDGASAAPIAGEEHIRDASPMFIGDDMLVLINVADEIPAIRSR